MIYVICTVPVSPMRFEPFHVSEMVSQVLFGEQCQVLETAVGGFVKVRSVHDGYEGYCSESQFTTCTAETQAGKLATKWMNDIVVGESTMKVPFGSFIPETVEMPIEESSQNEPHNQNDEMPIEESSQDGPHHQKDEQVLRWAAFMFLNTPYLWGGRSVFGADCSGFVQTVFRYINIALPRDAARQAEKGEQVGLLQEAKCGDLAFFDDPEGDIIHVGILLNDSSIIHAYGKVRVDKIDNDGIVNTDTGNRTHQLRIIKRFR